MGMSSRNIGAYGGALIRFLVWKNPDLGGGIPPDPPVGGSCAVLTQTHAEETSARFGSLPQTPSKGSICVKRGAAFTPPYVLVGDC
jgi:hypothetical protein